MVKIVLKKTKGSAAPAKQAACTSKPSAQASTKGKVPPPAEKQPTKPVRTSAASKKAPPAKKPPPPKGSKKTAPVADQDEDGNEDDENADGDAQPHDENEDDNGDEDEATGGAEDDDLEEPALLQRFRRLDARASLDARKKQGTEKMYQTIRVLIRHVTEYCNPTTVLTDGLVLATMDESDLPSAVAEEFNDDVFNEMLWPEFIKWLPELEQHLEAFSEDPDLIDHVGSYISAVAKKTRSDDLPRVKAQIIKLAGIPDGENVFIDKSNRGFNNMATARYLCPASEIDDFEADPVSYCRLARKGKKLILSEDWPMLCYDERRRDKRDPKAGLFRSKLAIKVYKLIFTGRGSALDEFYKATGNIKGKLPVSKKAKLEKVTIGSITYVHLLIRFAFNSQPMWDDSDGPNWHAAKFTRSIFNAAFESPKWAAELEAWWTGKIFGSSREDPPELKQKRKTTALALFKRTSERHLKRRGASPEEQDSSDIHAKDSKGGTNNGEDDQNDEDKDDEDGMNNNGHARNEDGMVGNGGANDNSAEGEAGEDGPQHADDGGSNTQHQQSTPASHDRNASGRGRVKRKITEWQPDLAAIAAGPSKRAKSAPQDAPQSPSAMDGSEGPTGCGTGQPEATAREGSDLEDMYA